MSEQVATKAGMCCLCGLQIWAGDEIRTWEVGDAIRAAHSTCVESSGAQAQPNTPRPEVTVQSLCPKCHYQHEGDCKFTLAESTQPAEGCPQVGTFSHHSESFYDNGTCEFCGAKGNAPLCLGPAEGMEQRAAEFARNNSQVPWYPLMAAFAASERADERRVALEEACKAVCYWCAQGEDTKEVAGFPSHWDEKLGYNRICAAVPIRKLLEARQ